MNLVRQQIDGSERTILKSGATFNDLHAEVSRLQTALGYRLEPRPGGQYLAVHPFFAGTFALGLEPEDGSPAPAELERRGDQGKNGNGA